LKGDYPGLKPTEFQWSNFMQWQDVLADKSLQDLPYKIELNEKGNIEMSPASIIHSLLQGEMALLLGNNLGGCVFTELAIQTSNGVRVPDVAWGSQNFIRKHKDELFASSAPEICVEIISPSNTAKEMLDKTQLFIEAGAQEVWLVTESGDISFYNKDGQIDTSEFDIKTDKITLNL
jgi:Uma2 family endonuclease